MLASAAVIARAPARRRSTRWVAIALVALAAHAIGLFHDAWIRHARCAEHGEVIHAEDGAVELTPPVARDPATHAHDLVLPGGASPRHPAEHDHCQPVLARAAAAPVLPTAVVAPEPAAATPPPIAATASERPRYRLAPKTSPPASA